MPIKVGWKTSEFWLSLAAVILSALFAAGIFPSGSLWEKLAGIGAVVLSALGYTVSRGIAKVGSGKTTTPLLLLVGFGASLILSGCASITTNLSRVQSATQQLSAVAEPMMHDRCLSIVADCGAKGDKVCQKMTDCMSQRHTFNSVVKGIHLAIASGASLYAIGNTDGAKQRLLQAVAELGRITRIVDEFKAVAK